MRVRGKRLFVVLFVMMSFQMAMGGNLDTSRKKALSQYVDEVKQRYGIPGCAVAVMHQDKVLYQYCTGLADLEHQLEAKASTPFPLYSVSKIFAAVYTFQCIEQGLFRLQDPIGRYLTDLPTTWQSITIHQLLSHQSGLPDILHYDTWPEEKARAAVYADSIACEPGKTFIYNQSNYWLLQRLCKKVTGQSTDEGLSARQMTPAGITSPLFPDAFKETVPLARRYEAGENGEMRYAAVRFPRFMDLAGGAALSLNDFIAWNRALDAHSLLAAETMAPMWAFEGAALGEGTVYGNGWIVSEIAGEKSVGMTGGTHVGILKVPSKAVTVIFLTNGYARYSNPGEITQVLAGLAFPELASPDMAFRMEIQSQFSTAAPSAIVQRLQSGLKSAVMDSVSIMQLTNQLGYAYLGQENVEGALLLFQLNVSNFPNNANGYDSLGEACFAAKDYANAQLNLEKALALKPDNPHARALLKQIEDMK